MSLNQSLTDFPLFTKLPAFSLPYCNWIGGKGNQEASKEAIL